MYSATPHHCLHWIQKTMLRIFGDNQPRCAVDDAKQLLLDSSRSTCWKSTGMAEFRVTGLKQKMKGKSTILIYIHTRKINFWKIISFQLLYSLKQLAWNSGSHVCSKHISTSGIRQLKKLPRSPPNSPNSTSMASAGAPWTTTQRKWDLARPGAPSSQWWPGPSDACLPRRGASKPSEDQSLGSGVATCVGDDWCAWNYSLFIINFHYYFFFNYQSLIINYHWFDYY